MHAINIAASGWVANEGSGEKALLLQSTNFCKIKQIIQQMQEKMLRKTVK